MYRQEWVGSNADGYFQSLVFLCGCEWHIYLFDLSVNGWAMEDLQVGDSQQLHVTQFL